MIEEHAIVVCVKTDSIVIETKRQTACGGCQANESCGQKSLSEWAASRMTHIEVPLPTSCVVKEGDSVVVGIDEGSFVKASAITYLLPLIVMIFSGLALQWLGFSEPWVIFSTFAGLIVSFLLLRLFNRISEKRAVYQPVILRIC